MLSAPPTPRAVHADCFRCAECHKQLDPHSELVFFNDSDTQRTAYHKQCVPHFRLRPSAPQLAAEHK